MQDFQDMCQNVKAIRLEELVASRGGYDTLVFEGAQGLALDKDNLEDFPHLTPSNTGIKNVVETLQEEGIEYDSFEAWYVTRSYFTRHGAGRFETECSKEEINKDIEDKTNVPNPYQDTIRYGRMDVDAVLKRIEKDQSFITNGVRNLVVTHCNYRQLTKEEKGKIEAFGFKNVLFVDKPWID